MTDTGRLKSFVERLASLLKREEEIEAELRQISAEMFELFGVGPGCTYIIAAESSGLVKIGRTFDIGARLKALQTGSAEVLNIRRVLPFDCERAMHTRFSHLRRHGEWFSFDPEMLTVALSDFATGRPVENGSATETPGGPVIVDNPGGDHDAGPVMGPVLEVARVAPPADLRTPEEIMGEHPEFLRRHA